MSTSPSSSAQQARQVIANRLREILRDSGLTARALAAAAGWDESKCSRLIHARTLPSDEDIRVWCRICEAESEVNDLIAASRDADSMYVEWKRLQRGGMKRLQEMRVSLYEQTRLFRFYSSQFIPWPLQTPGYMRSVLSCFADFHGTPGDIDEAVATRLARGRLLREGDHRFAMLVEESVLRDRVADDGAMAEQLGHLLEGMSLPSVSLGIIPFTLRAGRSSVSPRCRVVSPLDSPRGWTRPPGACSSKQSPTGRRPRRSTSASASLAPCCPRRCPLRACCGAGTPQGGSR